MDIKSFVIGLAKGKKSGSGYFSTKENDAGGLTYEFRAEESEGVNIAYGDTAPEDTTKLWVKINKNPKSVTVEGPNNFMRTEKTFDDYLRTSNSCAEVDGKLYIVATKAANLSVASKDIYCYDPETGEFDLLPSSLELVAEGAACASYGKKVYVFGGKDGYVVTNKIQCYDTETGLLSTLTATMPISATNQTCQAVGKDIYLFGGESSNYNTTYNTIIHFDCDTETASTLSVNIAQKRSQIGSVLHEGKIYLFGGVYSYNDYNYTQCFDPVAKTLTTLTSMPIKMVGMFCISHNSKIYIIGGNGLAISPNIYNENIYEFDPVTNKYTILHNRLPNMSRGCCIVRDGVVHIVAPRCKGNITDNSNYVWTLDLEKKVEKERLLIMVAAGCPEADIMKTNDIHFTLPIAKTYVGNVSGIGEEVESALYKDGEWVTI